MKTTIFTFILCSVFHVLFAQEICDNGIDDDNDGRVDLNDPDCECRKKSNLSLIPNHSFEDRSCCPTNIGQMHCADQWIQASGATSDYFNMCYFSGNVPLPIPDGNGFVGFYNVRTGNKEYIGTCLNTSMMPDNEYSIDFDIALRSGEPNIEVVIYGTTDCKNLPFSIGKGCPTKYPGWVVLGSTMVKTSNERWIRGNITFTPNQNISAIAIGPNCTSSKPGYYYLDDLQLVKNTSLLSIIETDTSNGSKHQLEIKRLDTVAAPVSYQWYELGRALVGQTKPMLDLSSLEYSYGNYSLLVHYKDGSCSISNEIYPEIPLKSFDEANIYFDFNSATLTDESLVILDKAVTSLISQPKTVIKLAAYADYEGEESYNLSLSQKRAKFCTAYLVSKGITPDRIVSKSYGETRTLSEYYTSDKYSKQQNKVNRKIEIKIDKL